jgi:hypothetical protein
MTQDNELPTILQATSDVALNAVAAPTIPVEEATRQLSEAELRLMSALVNGKKINTFQRRLQGTPALTPKVKQSRFWYMGGLLSKEEHDKLSSEQIAASKEFERSVLAQKRAAKKGR